MKTKLLKSLLAIASLLCSIGVYAYDFEVDGIYYNILNETDKTIEVTYKDTGYNSYSGDIVLQETVSYNDELYYIVKIGDRAFSKCDALYTVTLPNNVSNLGIGVFHDSNNLTEIHASNGVSTNSSQIFYNCTSLKSVVIDNNTTIINDEVFRGCSSLNKITIPQNITNLGEYAIAGCSGLIEIKVEAINPPYAESNTFNVIDKSIPVYVPAESVEAYKQAEYWSEFTNIVAYAELEAGDKFTVDGIHYEVLNESGQVAVTYYGEDKWNVPEEYKYAGEVVIPETVSYQGATYSVTSIGQNAFYNCYGLTSITIPESVTYIGDYAFYDCYGLTSITIPNSVASIGYHAFYDCYGLTSITIPNSVTSIVAWAFYDCDGLTSITIPNSVTSIGDYAFGACDGLTSITIPNSVASIGDNAFANCGGLTEITIPESVTSIGDNAFANCGGLTSMVVEEGNTVYDSRENCNAIIETATNTLVAGCKKTIIPNSVTSIGNNAFYDCRELTTITIPNSVTSIGYDAFSQCHGLTEITIPESVTLIGDHAFHFCSGLTSIRIEAVNPPAIEEGTFREVDKTIPVYVPAESVEAYQSAKYWSEFTNIVAYTELEAGDKFTVDGIHYEVLNESGQVAVTYYGEDINNIPDEYKYAGTVVIPESVTYEGVTYNVTAIGDLAFYSCFSLTSITIPNSVTSIGELAFSSCYGLKSIVVEEGNTVYDSRENCNAIIETATNTLLAGCQNTIIPNSVTSIGDDAFYWCDGLTSIIIPSSVTSIGEGVFFYCNGLTLIRVEAVNPPTIEYSTFENVDKSIPVYVPQGCAEVYRNAEYWSEFTNILEDCCIDANDAKVVKIDGVMKHEEILFPISLNNSVEIAGLQCDIFLPDGLTPVMQGDKYDIVLSSRAEDFNVTAKLRNDGALRVVIVNTALDLISGNDGELFTIKLKPNEQYSTDDNIAIRNIVMTGSDYAEYEASDVVISCTIKESITGDSNRDLKVNVTDLSQMANYVAGNELGTFDVDGADANQDGKVDGADIDTVSDVVVKASKAEAQNNTEVTETTENRLEAEVIEVVKMDGVVVTNPISLPIALTNTATITAIQCDITVPAGLTLVVNDDVADITPSERLGESHVVKSAWLDNGALRVLIYSPTAEGVEGESGTLFTLQLQPNESYEADATIEVKNITMASTDAVEYNAMPLSISCTVKESYKGDVNRDGKVNVTDVIVTIGKVLSVYDGEFDTVAADIDQDGEITIVDAVGIINLVLDEGDTPSQARMQDDEYTEGVLTMQDVKMSRGETKDLVIGLTNEAPYTAFQMDVTLPAGLNIEHITLSGRADGHTLQWQAQADGSVRIVGYALDNAAITGNDGALLTLTVSSDSQFETGEVVVSNAIFSTRQLVSHRMERTTVKVSNITALNDVVTATRIYAADHKVVVDSPVAQEAAISTIDGVVQRVALQPGRNEIPLQQGVYIVAVDAEVKKVVIR